MPSYRIMSSVVFSECIYGSRHCSRHLGQIIDQNKDPCTCEACILGEGEEAKL